jgi:hypothetical protein
VWKCKPDDAQPGEKSSDKPREGIERAERVTRKLAANELFVSGNFDLYHGSLLMRNHRLYAAIYYKGAEQNKSADLMI